MIANDKVEKKSPESESRVETSEAVSSEIKEGTKDLVKADKTAMESQKDTENRPANPTTNTFGRPEIVGDDGKAVVHGHRGKLVGRGTSSDAVEDRSPSGAVNDSWQAQAKRLGIPDVISKASFNPVTDGRPASEARTDIATSPLIARSDAAAIVPGKADSTPRPEAHPDAGMPIGKVSKEVPGPAAIGAEWDEAAKSGKFGNVNASLMRAIADAHRKGGPEAVEQLNDALIDGVKTKDGLPIFVQEGDKVTVHHVKQVPEEKQDVYKQLTPDERKKLGIVDVPGQGLMQEVSPPLTVYLPHKPGTPDAPTKSEKPGDAASAKKPEVPKTGSAVLLDSKSSPEEKLKAALDMAHKGQTDFTGPDGKKYHISTENYKSREGVEIFGTDENGKERPLLRGLVDKADGKVSRQQQNGKEVDYVGDYAKKHMKDNPIIKHDETPKKSEAKDSPKPPEAKDPAGGLDPEKILAQIPEEVKEIARRIRDIAVGSAEPVHQVEPGNEQPTWRKEQPPVVHQVEPGNEQPTWRKDQTPVGHQVEAGHKLVARGSQAEADKEGGQKFEQWLRGDDLSKEDIAKIGADLDKCRREGGDLKKKVAEMNRELDAQGYSQTIELGLVARHTGKIGFKLIKKQEK